jgi:type 1 glutamine amidotransferase
MSVNRGLTPPLAKEPAMLTLMLAAALVAPPAPVKLALVSGSLEYQSDESLASFQKLLEAKYRVECVRMFRKTDTDIPGLDKLKECDAALFFTRRLTPDAESLAAIKAFCASGKPVLGVRTASHGFQNFLDMDKLVYGGSYANHTAKGTATAVTVRAANADHPVLKGVKPFTSVGTLYKNATLAGGVVPLLDGTAGEFTFPVAWVRTRDLPAGKQRVFYTSLGHPDDFRDANFTTLLTNALAWALDKPLPVR